MAKLDYKGDVANALRRNPLAEKKAEETVETIFKKLKTVMEENIEKSNGKKE
ncbi:MAG: hypothetical protein PHU63_02105 [Candidatus ainarchaeum sp.]|nr:hypothetical protein [Candidatus ainarchaeum sp.]